jgi:hypothetical protein
VDGLRDDPDGDEPTDPSYSIGTTARIDGASVPL